MPDHERAAVPAASAELSALALANLPLPQLMQRTAEHLRAVLQVDATALLEFDATGDLMRVQAAAGPWPAGAVGNFEVAAGEGSLAGLTVATKGPLLIPDLRAEPRLRRPVVLVELGMISALSVVIPGRDRPFGVLGAYHRSRRSFDQNDANFLQTIANFVGSAVERHRDEEQIRFQARILDTMAQAAVALDADGRITYWNRAAETLYGWSAAEVMGSNALEHLVPVVEADRAVKVMTALRAGRPWIGEFMLQRKDGTTFPALITDSALFDRDGNVIGFVGLTHDLTAQRKLEEQLQQAQKMEAIGRLAGGVAHDFNNVLTGILGVTQFLLEEFPDPGDVRADLERIQTAAQRAATLTRQLLTLGRRELLELRPVDLTQAVHELEPMLKRVLGEDVSVVLDLHAETLFVRADPVQLDQVLLNLVVNARDAMPTGGRLRIATRPDSGTPGESGSAAAARPRACGVLEVTDTGSGMSPEVRSRIFEPFFTTKEHGKGSGLGLSTVYSIVKQSGGRIEVESEPGLGSTFRVFLPAEGQAAAETAADPGESPTSPVAHTILLVEDDGIVRTLAARALRSAGYTVLDAEHADRALEIAGTYDGPIDLLFTDVVMPGRSGRELADALAHVRTDTPVLFTSGYTDDAIVRHGVNEALVDLLQKPYSPETLLDRVRKAIRQHRSL